MADPKPFSTYPEDRAKLLDLARKCELSDDANAIELGDLVRGILEDEAVAISAAPLRIDWNKFDLAEAYDLVEGVRRGAAQDPESGIDGSLRDALNAIEAADCEWDGITDPVSA